MSFDTDNFVLCINVIYIDTILFKFVFKLLSLDDNVY